MDEQFGRYALLSKLGEGAMGVVYRAQRDDSQQFALKVISKAAIDSARHPEKLRKRFFREARLAAKCQHENIVRLYDYGEHGEMLYMVSELVLGGDLHELYKENAPLSELECLKLTIEILKGLSALDELRLIHRDLKPANILLGRDRVCKIADLGLARSTQNDHTLLTRPGQRLGTPLYMAPEMIDGAPIIDIRADLYALGAILFQGLTGSPPFQAKSIPVLFRAHLESPVPELDSHISAPTRSLVERLLAKNPAERPGNPAIALELCNSALSALDTEAFQENAIPTLRCPPVPQDTPRIESGQNVSVEDSLTGLHTMNTVPENSLGLQLEGNPKTAPEVVTLVLTGQDFKKTVFVYSKAKVRLGRSRSEEADNLCLRLIPAAENNDLNRKISGTHLLIQFEDKSAYLIDDQSSLGTTLNGQSMNAGQRVKIIDQCRANLAGVLEIEFSTQHHLTSQSVRGLKCNTRQVNPSILIERINNTREHRYLVVPDQAEFSFNDTGELHLKSPGEFLILCRESGLFIAPRLAHAFGPVRPLTPGIDVAIGSMRLRVVAFKSADQK